jgi:hypothetical protein
LAFLPTEKEVALDFIDRQSVIGFANTRRVMLLEDYSLPWEQLSIVLR